MTTMRLLCLQNVLKFLVAVAVVVVVVVVVFVVVVVVVNLI